MTEKIHEKNGVFVPPNSHFSYVISITLPQPTIRIKIPKVLVKAMQRRNRARSENDENGGKNKKKYRATSEKSFRKKVGSMVCNVFGKNKKSPESGSKGENGEVHSNGDDEEMKKLKKMIESLDMGSEKTTGKSSEEYILNDGVLQQMAVVAGFGKSEKEMVKAEDEEGKEEPMVMEAGNERKERPKSRRTYSKNLSKRIDTVELNNGKINNVGNTETKGVVSLKQGGNCNDLTRFRSKTVSSRRKPKIAWSVKKISDMVGGKSEKQELCKKRIIMGVRCRPLNHSGVIQYDENGVLIPEIVP